MEWHHNEVNLSSKNFRIGCIFFEQIGKNKPAYEELIQDKDKTSFFF